MNSLFFKNEDSIKIKVLHDPWLSSRPIGKNDISKKNYWLAASLKFKLESNSPIILVLIASKGPFTLANKLQMLWQKMTPKRQNISLKARLHWQINCRCCGKKWHPKDKYFPQSCKYLLVKHFYLIAGQFFFWAI